jgi:geranylgeranyl pyrophosphate synthase
LKLNGTHQLLVCADDDNVLGGSVHTLKKNTEVANKEAGIDVNTDKAKYMVMFRSQNAGRNHSINIDNCFFERVEEFKYRGTTSTNQNSIQEKIKLILKSRNSCCHSVQHFLSSSLLSRCLKIKIYRTIIFPVFCIGAKFSPSH